MAAWLVVVGALAGDGQQSAENKGVADDHDLRGGQSEIR
jgi:hypothetical protein